MTSIRRTLSPVYPFKNGGESFSPSAQKFSSKHNPSQFLPYLTKLSLKISRGGGWRRRPFYRILIFFLLGFLFGISPYGQIKDLNSTDRLDTVSFTAETEIGSNEKKEEVFDFLSRKLVIVVTPTCNRAMQAYYLNRLAQTLRLVESPVLWIVVESNAASFETSEILRKTGVMYRHLVCKRNTTTTSIKDRGVHQRNTALEHIELHKLDGIVYFADDDNIYSLELFRSLRLINRFGTWPVAMLAPSKNKAVLEGPVCNGSQVIGWHTNEKRKRLRRFHIDMSGFAFNSTILWDRRRWGLPFTHPIRQLDTVKEGFQETTFIEQVVADESEMEGVPQSCSRMLNWHLHLDARDVPYPQGWTMQKNLEALITVK